MAKDNNDLWLSDDTLVDFSRDREPLIDTVTAIANEHDNPAVDAALEAEQPPPAEEPPAPPPAPPAPAAEEPEVIDLEDGSSVTIEQTKRGLKATLESATGAKPEIFYGKDRDDLMRNVLVGKLNATKKIHDLTSRAKRAGGDAPVAQQQPGLPEQELTADQRFEIKAALDAGDMDKAMSLTFQYKYGKSLKDVVVGADQGKVAKSELDTEGVARAFINANPDYYPDAGNHNYHSILAWLCNKTGDIPYTAEALTQNPKTADAAMNHLIEGGFWTVQNLQRAYNALLEEGQMVGAPASLQVDEEEAEEEEVEPEVQPVVARRRPAAPREPAPTDERIVRTVRRPRAGLGIRPSAVSSAAVDTTSTTAPSVDELDSMSDAKFEELYSATIREARRGSARR